MPAHFDDSQIRELGNQWIDDGLKLHEYLGTMHSSVQSMGGGWTGKAGRAAQVVWNGVADHNIWHAIWEAGWVAQEIGKAIIGYADELQKAIKEINRAHLIEALTTVFGMVLGIASFGIAALLSRIATVVGEIVESIIASISKLAAAAAVVGRAAALTADSVLNAALTLGTDVLANVLGSAAVKAPVTIDWEGEGINMGLGVWMGAGMGGVEQHILDPRAIAAKDLTNLPAPTPTPTPTPANISLPKNSPTAHSAIPAPVGLTPFNMNSVIETSHVPPTAAGVTGAPTDAPRANAGSAAGGAPLPGNVLPAKGAGQTSGTADSGVPAPGVNTPTVPGRPVTAAGGEQAPPNPVRGNATPASGTPQAYLDGPPRSAGNGPGRATVAPPAPHEPGTGGKGAATDGPGPRNQVPPGTSAAPQAASAGATTPKTATSHSGGGRADIPPNTATSHGPATTGGVRENPPGRAPASQAGAGGTPTTASGGGRPTPANTTAHLDPVHAGANLPKDGVASGPKGPPTTGSGGSFPGSGRKLGGLVADPHGQVLPGPAEHTGQGAGGQAPWPTRSGAGYDRPATAADIPPGGAGRTDTATGTTGENFPGSGHKLGGRVQNPHGTTVKGPGHNPATSSSTGEGDFTPFSGSGRKLGGPVADPHGQVLPGPAEHTGQGAGGQAPWPTRSGAGYDRPATAADIPPGGAGRTDTATGTTGENFPGSGHKLGGRVQNPHGTTVKGPGPNPATSSSTGDGTATAFPGSGHKLGGRVKNPHGTVVRGSGHTAAAGPGTGDGTATPFSGPGHKPGGRGDLNAWLDALDAARTPSSSAPGSPAHKAGPIRPGENTPGRGSETAVPPPPRGGPGYDRPAQLSDLLARDNAGYGTTPGGERGSSGGATVENLGAGSLTLVEHVTPDGSVRANEHTAPTEHKAPPDKHGPGSEDGAPAPGHEHDTLAGLGKSRQEAGSASGGNAARTSGGTAEPGAVPPHLTQSDSTPLPTSAGHPDADASRTGGGQEGAGVGTELKTAPPGRAPDWNGDAVSRATAGGQTQGLGPHDGARLANAPANRWDIDKALEVLGDSRLNDHTVAHALENAWTIVSLRAHRTLPGVDPRTMAPLLPRPEAGSMAVGLPSITRAQYLVAAQIIGHGVHSAQNLAGQIMPGPVQQGGETPTVLYGAVYDPVADTIQVGSHTVPLVELPDFLASNMGRFPGQAVILSAPGNVGDSGTPGAASRLAEELQAAVIFPVAPDRPSAEPSWAAFDPGTDVARTAGSLGEVLGRVSEPAPAGAGVGSALSAGSAGRAAAADAPSARPTVTNRGAVAKGKAVDRTPAPEKQRPEFVQGSSSGRPEEPSGDEQVTLDQALLEAYQDEPLLQGLTPGEVREAFAMQQYTDPSIPGMRQRQRLHGLGRIARALHERGTEAALSLATDLAENDNRPGIFAGVRGPVSDASPTGGRGGAAPDSSEADRATPESDLELRPKEFLQANALSTNLGRGLRLYAPRLEDSVRNTFLDSILGSLPEHRFVLTPQGRDTTGKPAYILTPAVEWYAKRYGASAVGIPENALPPVRPEKDYLNVVFVPYLTGSPSNYAQSVGHADVQRNPEPSGPRLVVTPTMNGCAYAVTRGSDPERFTVWHYQSPDSNMPRPLEFRRELRPTDWFGAEEYYGSVPQGFLFEVANLMWFGPNGWEILSQENHTDADDSGVVTLKEFRSRPVALDPGLEVRGTVKAYQSLARSERDQSNWFLQQTRSKIREVRPAGQDGPLLENLFTAIDAHITGEIEQLGQIDSFDELRSMADTLMAGRAARKPNLELEIGKAIAATVQTSAETARKAVTIRRQLAERMVTEFTYRPAKNWIGLLRSEAAPQHPKTVAAVIAAMARDELDNVGSSVNVASEDLRAFKFSGLTGTFVRRLLEKVRKEIALEIEELGEIADLATLRRLPEKFRNDRYQIKVLELSTLMGESRGWKRNDRQQAERAQGPVTALLDALVTPRMEDWIGILQQEADALAANSAWHALTKADQVELKGLVAGRVPVDGFFDLNVQQVYDRLTTAELNRPLRERGDLVATALAAGERQMDESFVQQVNTRLRGLAREQVSSERVARAYRELESSRGAAFTRGSSVDQQEAIAYFLAGLGRTARVGGALGGEAVPTVQGTRLGVSGLHADGTPSAPSEYRGALVGTPDTTRGQVPATAALPGVGVTSAVPQGSPPRLASGVTSAGPLRYRERLALAKREWQGPVSEEVGRLESMLRAAGPGARSLVLGIVPDVQLWAWNFGGTIRWLEHRTGMEAQTPVSSSGQVTSIDLDPKGMLIRPDPRLGQTGTTSTSFCELALGADLKHVV